MSHVDEVLQLKHKGSVDTPTKFGKGFRPRYRRILVAIRTFLDNRISENIE